MSKYIFAVVAAVALALPSFAEAGCRVARARNKVIVQNAAIVATPVFTVAVPVQEVVAVQTAAVVNLSTPVISLSTPVFQVQRVAKIRKRG